MAITYFSGGALSGVSASMMTGLSGAMINGAILGASMAGGMTAAYGGSFQDVLNSAFKGAYTGAASAAVFYGIGSAFSGAKINYQFGSAGYFAKTAVHGVAGGVQSEMQGGDFKDGFIGASVSNAFAPMTESLFAQQNQVFQRVAFSGAVGGLAAYASGGDVAMGMTTAAYSRWFNCELHPRTIDLVEPGYKAWKMTPSSLPYEGRTEFGDSGGALIDLLYTVYEVYRNNPTPHAPVSLPRTSPGNYNPYLH